MVTAGVVIINKKEKKMIANELVYTHYSAELNEKVTELMEDYAKLVKKAKSFGLDIRLYDESETLELYFNDDYPDTLLVDKSLSSLRRVKSIKGLIHYKDGRKVPILSVRVNDRGRHELVTRTGVLTNLIDDWNMERVEIFDVEQSPDKYSELLNG